MGKPSDATLEAKIREKLQSLGVVPDADLVQTLAEQVPQIGGDLAHTLTFGCASSVYPSPANDTGRVTESIVPPAQVTPEAKGRYIFGSPDGAAASELGRGGMGRVLLCQDTHIARQVALKELLTDPDGNAPSRGEELRLLKEARICGRLEHPNIVPVYEVGRREDGRLYYTMRVIRGRTLSQAMRDAGSTQQRLALLAHFSGLCQAIAYAHSQGIVHRDIKPENVMIGEFGETVLLDWGAASPRTDGGEVGLSPESNHSEFVATPLYMSPEQALGSSEVADERSDVWSLGVVLYQLICGKPPFVAPSLTQLIKKIVTGEYKEVLRVCPDAPRELSAVVCRALQVRRDDRYPDARSMMHDIEAFRNGERVAVYSYSAVELFRKFVERHRAAAVVSIGGFCLLLLTLSVAYFRVSRALDRAVAAERLATVNEHRALENSIEARHNLAEVFATQAGHSLAQGDRVAAQIFAAKALSLEERSDARGVAVATTGASSWQMPTSNIAAKKSRTTTGSPAAQPSFTVDRKDAKTLLVNTSDGRALTISWKENISAYSAMGHQLAVGGRLGRLVVYDTKLAGDAGWAGRKLLGHAGTITSISRSLDGKQLATTSSDRTLRLWDLRRGDGRNQRVVSTEPCHSSGFSPNGRFLAYATAREQLGIFDLRLHRTVYFIRGAGGERSHVRFDSAGALHVEEPGRPRRSWQFYPGAAPRLISKSNLLAAAFAPRSPHVLAAGIGRDGVCMFRLPEGECETQLPVSAETVRSLAVSAQGKYLALGGADGFAMVWDLKTKLPQAVLSGHTKDVRGMVFSSDETQLLSVGLDSTLRSWMVNSGTGVNTTRLRAAGYSLAALGNHSRVAVGLANGEIAIYGGGRLLSRWQAHSDWVMGLSLSGDRSLLASAGADGMVRTWSLPAEGGVGRLIAEFAAGAGRVLAVAVRARGDLLAAAGEDHSIRLFSPRSGALLAILDEHDAAVRSLSFSLDDALLLSASDDRTVGLWSLSTLDRSGESLLKEALNVHHMRLHGTRVTAE